MILFPQYYLCVKLEAEVYVKVNTEWESELLHSNQARRSHSYWYHQGFYGWGK